MSYYSRSPKHCEFCGKIFTPESAATRFCCRKCYTAWRKNPNKSKQAAKEPAKPQKPLADWIQEAAECNLDYGTYRGLIAQGKSFDQLKALAPTRNPCAHNHSHRSPTFIH